MNLKNMFERCKDKIRRENEKRHLRSLRARLKNDNFTIVCNNCIGGVMYHNLGKRFLSPTINLFISSEDYLAFVKDFKYYSKCDLIEYTEEPSDYPIGLIVPADDAHIPIKVYFQHYPSFDVAKEKWISRYSRVNWDNIYYIWEFYDTLYDRELMYAFDELPDIKKVLITHKKFDHLKSSVAVSCYKDDQPIARILDYDGISGKRFLDEFDYVRFFNDDGLRSSK